MTIVLLTSETLISRKAMFVYGGMECVDVLEEVIKTFNTASPEDEDVVNESLEKPERICALTK